MIGSYRAIETAQQARVAEESERLHRTLLDSVSHELKTPLAVISAATEGLDTQLKDAGLPLSETFLDEIKAANRRLDRIVTNLLDMTRIDSGRLPLNLEWGEARELLESAVSQVENEVSRERVRITVPENLPLVQLDFGLMEQALCNLIMNAAQHSPAGAPIELSAHSTARRCNCASATVAQAWFPGKRRKYSRNSIAVPPRGPAVRGWIVDRAGHRARASG